RMKGGIRGSTLRAMPDVIFDAAARRHAHKAHTINLDTVVATLRGYRAGTLVLAAVLVAASYAAYAGYELTSRRYSGHRLPVRLVALVGLIAYAFNLNFGAWLGGIGFRYRLYSQLGVTPATTARLYVSTLVTNWTGYLAVAGVVFACYGLDLPDEWKLSDEGLRWIGVLLLPAAAAVLLVCARARRRRWTVRGHEVELPDGRLAAAQMALGAANWLLIGAVIYTLLPHVD